jgi:hypothetical protein
LIGASVYFGMDGGKVRTGNIDWRASAVKNRIGSSAAKASGLKTRDFAEPINSLRQLVTAF